ncbi:MAG: IS200/IS605 family transposase [Alphaproteobacteria bacterium]|nr:IS200/IS605 family transposase [Alphaproteobacteria bacterium]
MGDIGCHIVSYVKYRMIYNNIVERGIEVIREICAANYVDVISENVSPDHVHMLISAPPHLSVSKIVQYMRGKSSRKLQGEFQELRNGNGNNTCG